MNRLLCRLSVLAIVLVLAAVATSGCGGNSPSSHPAVTDGELCQFRLGTTSIDDVTKLLGAPTRSGTTGPIYYLLYDYPASDSTPVVLVFSFQAGYLEEVSRKAGSETQVDGLPSCNGASAPGGSP